MNPEMAIYLGAGALVFGLIGLIAAATKGNGMAGFFWGLFLGPLGIIIAMLMPENPTSKKSLCPHCKIPVSNGAKSCRKCGGILVKKSFHRVDPIDPIDAWEAKQGSRPD